MEERSLLGFSHYRFREDGEVISSWGGEFAVLRGGADHDGYRKYVLIDDSGRRRYVRRASLICTAFHGPRPRGYGVRHLDGSRTNDIPSNLKWGTQAENMADKWAHGTMPLGPLHHNTKLTIEQVGYIRRSHERYQSLAERFGVSKSAIAAVKTGRTWAWLT